MTVCKSDTTFQPGSFQTTGSPSQFILVSLVMSRSQSKNRARVRKQPRENPRLLFHSYFFKLHPRRNTNKRRTAPSLGSFLLLKPKNFNFTENVARALTWVLVLGHIFTSVQSYGAIVVRVILCVDTNGITAISKQTIPSEATDIMFSPSCFKAECERVLSFKCNFRGQ